MDRELKAFNKKVKDWALSQPAKYRKTALAFGYRCDKREHCFTGTLKWTSKKSRERTGEGVSVSTLKRHLKVFQDEGLIKVEHGQRKQSDRNVASTYHVDFDAVIDDWASDPIPARVAPPPVILEDPDDEPEEPEALTEDEAHYARVNTDQPPQPSPNKSDEEIVAIERMETFDWRAVLS
jgi:hypothetical protein